MLRARESTTSLKLESMDVEEGPSTKPQYNVFQDYLGLINLICPSERFCSTVCSPCDSVSSVGSMYDFPIEGTHRHRMDSLDSDGLSDSSGESREYEAFENDLFSRSCNSSPPLPPILKSPSSYQTLETLIATQNSILSRMHPISKDNRNSKNSNKATVCVFCRNNGESREFYSSHTLKDNEGNTACPILRAYTCPLCKANGDNSHTIKYCPKYTPKLKVEKLLGVGIPL